MKKFFGIFDNILGAFFWLFIFFKYLGSYFVMCAFEINFDKTSLVYLCLFLPLFIYFIIWNFRVIHTHLEISCPERVG